MMMTTAMKVAGMRSAALVAALTLISMPAPASAESLREALAKAYATSPELLG